MARQNNTIPMEAILKAFEAVSVDDDEVEIKLVTPEDYPAVLSLMEIHYHPDEPVIKAIGLAWGPEVASMHESVLRENLSLMAVSRKSREVVGVRIMKVGQDDQQLDTSSVSHATVRLLMDIINDMLAMGDFFNRYGVKRTFHFFGLAVNRNYRNMGIASKLMNAAVDFASALGKEIGVTCLRGEGSSNFSKKIYENLGFDLILELPYKDYKLNGVVVIQNTGEHKSYRAYGKVIQ